MTMQIEKMKSINPGNPFLEDSYHMGTKLGENCIVMYKNFPTKECPYLIIIDTITGERIRIRLIPEKKNETFSENMIDIVENKSGTSSGERMKFRDLSLIGKTPNF